MTGYETGFDNYGSNNVFYGFMAGLSNTNGNFNIAIGAGAGSTAGPTQSNNIYIGNPGTNETGPAIRIGVQGNPHINQTYIGGIVTNLFPPNSGASVVLIDGTGHLGVSGASLGGPVTAAAASAQFLDQVDGQRHRRLHPHMGEHGRKLFRWYRTRFPSRYVEFDETTAG